MTDHVMFSGAYPYTAGVGTDANDGILVWNNFYVYGHVGWRVKGARVWVPSGSSQIGATATVGAWVPRLLPGEAGLRSPEASASISSLVAGWNVVTFTPTAIPDIIATGNRFSVGYTTKDYTYADLATGPVRADDLSDLYLSEPDAANGLRGGFKYTNRSDNGNASFGWGIDILVDEGAPLYPQLDILQSGTWVRANVLGVGVSGALVPVTVL